MFDFIVCLIDTYETFFLIGIFTLLWNTILSWFSLLSITAWYEIHKISFGKKLAVLSILKVNDKSFFDKNMLLMQKNTPLFLKWGVWVVANWKKWKNKKLFWLAQMAAFYTKNQYFNKEIIFYHLFVMTNQFLFLH